VGLDAAEQQAEARVWPGVQGAVVEPAERAAVLPAVVAQGAVLPAVVALAVGLLVAEAPVAGRLVAVALAAGPPAVAV
jgi:hypothetical protein